MPGLLKTIFPQERPSTLQSSCLNDQPGLKFEDDWVSGIIFVTFCYLAVALQRETRENRNGGGPGEVSPCV